MTGERSGQRLHSLPGACSLASKDAQERAPPRITDAFGEGVVADQVGNPQVFMVDHIVRLDKLGGFFVVAVASLTGNVLLGFCQPRQRFAPPVAPLRAPSYPP